jgi:hypothetical protein
MQQGSKEIVSTFPVETTEGLLRGKRAFPLKGDSEAEVSAERQRDEVPMELVLKDRCLSEN